MELPIPIKILKKGDKLPQETCYLVTQDGIFLHKFTEVIESLIKVEGICFLESVDQKAILHLQKLPMMFMATALSFFHRIHTDLDSEVNLFMHYSAGNKKEQFKLTCPRQNVTASSVRYDAMERIEGYQLIGTIHSHNTMTAWHSGIDQTDESCFDGLHITVGRLDKFPVFSLSCSVVVNGVRFKINPADVVLGIKEVEPENPLPRPGASKRKFVSKVWEVIDRAILPPKIHGFYGSQWGYDDGNVYWQSYHRPELYELVFPSGDGLPAVFPEEWLGKVKKLTFTGLSQTQTFEDKRHFEEGQLS